MKVVKRQPNSKDCIICGMNNPLGVKAAFYEMEDKTLIAAFTFHSEHQSYPERTHGGMISAMLDESIGRVLWIEEPKAFGVTIRLNVSFHKPVPYDEELYCTARLTKKNAISFQGTAEIRNKKNEVLANADALYMRLALDKIAPEHAHEGHLHADEFDINVPDDLKEINLGE